jgi:hypothetical protein
MSVPSTSPRAHGHGPGSSSPETAIFLHIPKTGGMTMDGVIERLYRQGQRFATDPFRHWESLDQFRALPEEQRASYPIIYGHMAFGIHEAVPNPCSYFTILRDPIDRTVSAYHYVRENVDHPYHRTLHDSGLDLKGILERRAFAVVPPNQQVKMLTGYYDKDYVMGRPELERAKRNLVEHFSVAGVTESFDQALVLVADRYGWRDVWYEVRNTTRKRPDVRQLDPATLEALRDYNALDLELYEFARERFEELARSYGPRLDRMLWDLRRRNRLHQRKAAIRRRLRAVATLLRLRSPGSTSRRADDSRPTT